MSATATTPVVAAPSQAGELWGGFAAMLVALPSSIAFGIVIYANLGADYVATGVLAGILGAIALGVVAPALGGAPRLISAPCAPAAAVLGGLAAPLLGDRSPSEVIVLLTLIGLLAGLLQLLYGGIGGGRLIKYIPYPVVSGYLSGVGIYILAAQIPKFLGITAQTGLWEALAHPAQWRWEGMVVGSVTILTMLAASKLTRKVPATILGLAAGLAAYFALAMFLPGLREFSKGNPLIIGPLFEGGAGLKSHLLDRWQAARGLRLNDLQLLITPALTLSVLLSIDTLKTCLVLDTLTRSRHNSNRELLAQGAGNTVSALVGGLPGAGTMGATLVNLSSGGQSRLSGVYEGLFVVAALALLRGLIGWIPLAALAGILMVVAGRMVDRHSLHLLKQKATFVDFLVIAAVVVVAQFNLIAATGAGLGLAILLFIREQIRGPVIRRKFYGHEISSKQYRLPPQRELLRQHGSQITVCELQGSLFFGNTDKLYTELEADLRLSRWLILDFRRVQSLDFSAAHLLEQIALQLTERGGCLILSSLPARLPTGQDPRAYLEQLGVLAAGHNLNLMESLDSALEWAEDNLLEEHRLLQRSHAPPLELTEMDLVREFEADHTLEALRQCVVERSCQAGETIFSKGDPGDQLFLIRRGVVRIELPLESGRPHVLATFGRGSFFGEVAFLDRGARSATAVAVTEVELYSMSRSRLDELSRSNPIIGVKLFARLARGLAIRLRFADGELRALKDS